jgi:hypothetical protein
MSEDQTVSGALMNLFSLCDLSLADMQAAARKKQFKKGLDKDEGRRR